MCSHAWSLSIRNHIFSAAITKDLSIFRFLFDTLDTSPNHPLHPGSAALYPFTIQRCFSFSQMLVSLRASEAGKPFLKFSLILCFSLHLVRADLIA